MARDVGPWGYPIDLGTGRRRGLQHAAGCAALIGLVLAAVLALACGGIPHYDPQRDLDGILAEYPGLAERGVRLVVDPALAGADPSGCPCALGRYDPATKTASVHPDPGPPLWVRGVALHELGHAYWHELMTMQERVVWHDEYARRKATGEWPSEYARVSVQELHAELFRIDGGG